MANNVVDYTEDYQNIIPAEIKKDLSIYKDLHAQLDVVQDKLEKNFYRVTDIDKLKQAVSDKRLRVAKYSIIEETPVGYRLVTFSDFFENEFKNIIKLLNKLSSNQKDKEYREYIESLSLAYSNNNFIDPYKRWVLLGSRLPYDFIFFPTEPYLDKEFETILSFEGHLKFTDPNQELPQERSMESVVRDVLSNTPDFSEVHSQLSMEKLTLRVDLSLLLAGATTKLGAIGQNLPNEREFVQMWGTKSTIHKTTVDKHIHDQYFPLTKYFQDQTLSEQDYIEGMTSVLFAHEITEALMKFAGDEERLGSRYLSVRELNSDSSGIKNYLLYLLKLHDSSDLPKKMAYFSVLSFLRAYDRFGNVDKPMQHYYGYIYTFNRLLKENSISINEAGLVVIDVKSTLKTIADISSETTDLLIKGTKSDAKQFFDPYLGTDTLKRLLKR